MENLPILKAKHPELTQTALMTACGQKWKDVAPQIRAVILLMLRCNNLTVIFIHLLQEYDRRAAEDKLLLQKQSEDYAHQLSNVNVPLAEDEDDEDEDVEIDVDDDDDDDDDDEDELPDFNLTHTSKSTSKVFNIIPPQSVSTTQNTKSKHNVIPTPTNIIPTVETKKITSTGTTAQTISKPAQSSIPVKIPSNPVVNVTNAEPAKDTGKKKHKKEKRETEAVEDIAIKKSKVNNFIKYILF